MTTHRTTTVAERQQFVDRHAAGETYAQIAQDGDWSEETVRYWCRQARDGGREALTPTDKRKTRGGAMSSYPGIVRYCFLRMKKKHPGWGAAVARARAREEHPVLADYALPSVSTIESLWAQYQKRLYTRYRKRGQPYREPRLSDPTAAHERWKADIKEWVAVAGVGRVNVFNIRDEVSAVKTASQVFPAGTPRKRVSLRQAQAACRRGFTRWGLCDRLKTDRDPGLIDRGADPFPSPFVLWLAGLGIRHEVAYSATDNSEVERFHRTWHGRAILGQRFTDLAHLQTCIDHELDWINHKLPSRAKDCQGRPPLEAHPEASSPRRPYTPQREWELFSMQRVYRFLAQRFWWRWVSAVGQIALGGQRYYVGRKHAATDVRITFDPDTVEFVAWNTDENEIKRLTPKRLTPADLTGLQPPPHESPPADA
jgi:hypothetical protein